MLWQSGWGYILPVWPCPGVSSDGATVSPVPSCLSLQYLCCSSLGSVSYIWSTSPVLSSVLCEFKYTLSNYLFLSLSRRTRALGSCLRTTWHDDSLLSPVHLACCCSSFNCSACDYYYLTMLVIYEHLNILAMFCYNLHQSQPEEDWPPLIAWFLSRFLPRFWPF